MKPTLFKLGKNRYTIALAASSFCFAFFWLPAPRIFDIACILLILLFVPAALSRANYDIRNDAVARTGILFFLYIVLSIIWHRFTLPDYFPNTTSDRRFLRVLYFVAIAYAIAYGRFIAAWQVLAAALGGLFLYLLFTFDPTEWQRAWQGERVDFGIHNAQHTGVVFATSTLALSFLTPRFFTWLRGTSTMKLRTGACLWIAALVFSVWGVIVSQTRGVWLGLGICVLALPGVLLIAHNLRRRPRFSLRKYVVIGVAGATFIGALIAACGLPDVLSQRLSAEKITLEHLRLAASHEDQPVTSIGIRVASWSAATDWIMERPLMGWGGRGSRPLIRHSELFSDWFKKTFDHLHNSYLQTLVEIGLLGAAFIVTIIFLTGRACMRSYKSGSMPLDVFLFAWAFFIFWAIVNFFESYIIYPSGTYLVAIVAGYFYSFCIDQNRPNSHV